MGALASSEHEKSAALPQRSGVARGLVLSSGAVPRSLKEDSAFVRIGAEMDVLMRRLPRSLQLADRQDIAQEAICRALRRLSARERSQERLLRRYLFVVATHLIERKFRFSVPVRLEELPVPVVAREPLPEKACQIAQRQQRVRDVLERLNPDHRQAIKWRYWDGLSIKAMAERAGVSHAAMTSTLRRACLIASSLLRRTSS